IRYQSDASGGSNPAETDYSYAFFTGTLQINQRTTTWPRVTTGQNGSGTANSRIEVFDEYGFLTWVKDERGFLTRFQTDQASAGVSQRIDDVDTTRSADSPSVPTGWATPTGGGLHLITDYTVDNLGRPTQELGPSHEIDISGTSTNIRRAHWTIYQDTTQEQWDGSGYQKVSDSSFTLINPVSITRFDRAY